MNAAYGPRMRALGAAAGAAAGALAFGAVALAAGVVGLAAEVACRLRSGAGRRALPKMLVAVEE